MPALDYLSPLPPVRSGISDYSVDLLPHLEERCDLRVLRLPDQPVAPEVQERWGPVPAEAALEDGRGERQPLFQMGNNPYHEAVETLARRFPGILVLHDWVLHHLASEVSLGRGVWEPYRERLGGDHGFLGEVIARPRRWGGYSDAALFSLPANRGLLRRQRGVLVHNGWTAERLREQDPELAVRVVPMGIPLPPPAPSREAAEVQAFRHRFDIPRGAPVLGSFGFQTPIKRTASAVAALAHPGLDEAHLLIVGEVSEHSGLVEAARRFGVEDRVHIAGFVPYEEFETAIAATDLCLNLRYPTAGETSASLLRVLALGRPAVVSDYAQFTELPDEAVLKVPLGGSASEPAALAAAVRQLLDDPGRLSALGRGARDHIERHHNPARAAAAVAAACEELGTLEPPGSAEAGPGDRPDPVLTSLTWGDLPARLEVSGAESPWAPGERRTLQVRLTNTGRAAWLPGDSGPGGVALRTALEPLAEAPSSPPDTPAPPPDLLASRPWVPLPRCIHPGQSCTVSIPIRRPPGPARLTFEPHVLGAGLLHPEARWTSSLR